MLLLDPDAVIWLLRDTDGNVRAAMVCWGLVLSAFIILRIPREVLLGCLIVAGATVGLAATVVEIAPQQATASIGAQDVLVARTQSAAYLRGPSAGATMQDRPY